MVKVIRLVHKSHAREIPEQAADHYLQAGWLQLDDAHPVGRSALWHRQYRRKRKEQRQKRFTAYLPLEIFEEIAVIKLPGETNSGLVIRLLNSLRKGDK